MSYDEQYEKTPALFGTEAEATLRQFAGRLAPGSTVLDIGAGQGRNTRFLAERGFAVHALEPSRVAVTALKRVIAENRWPVKTFPDTFERFDPPEDSYAGILVFGLIPDLEWAAIRKLVDRINGWSRPDTTVWITGFTTNDPAYGEHKTNWKTIGTHSFQSPGGQVRTYLEPDQILELFGQYTILSFWEGMGPEHRHGDGAPERHGKFEAVFAVMGG